VCFFCWGPKATTQAHKGTVPFNDCEVGDVLPQVAYAAWVEPTLRCQLEGIGLGRELTEETYMEWLVRKQGGMFNYIAVFWLINGIRGVV